MNLISNEQEEEIKENMFDIHNLENKETTNLLGNSIKLLNKIFQNQSDVEDFLDENNIKYILDCLNRVHKVIK